MRILFILLFLFPSISFPADYSVNLSEVRYADLVRLVYGDIFGRSFLLDKDVIESHDTVTVDWNKMSKSKLDSLMVELSRMRGFRFRDIGSVLVVDRFQPDEQTIVLYRPKHRSAHYLSELVQNLTGASVHLQKAAQNSFVTNPQPQLGQPHQELQSQSQPQPLQQFQPATSSIPGTSDIDDQIAFLVDPQDQKKVLKLLDDLDTPQGEVMLRAAVYEVGSTQADGGAVNLAAGLLHGFGGTLGAAVAGAASVSFKSANFDLVLAALDSDSRFKILSRPQVRVKSGSQAKFSVGQDVPTLGSASMDKNGNTIQSIVYRQSGIILTTTPEIRDNVIDLTIAQEMSSFSATTNGVNNSPTLYKRSVNSRLSIQPGEVVVFAGLQESREDNNTAKEPFFGWTLSREKKHANSEILVFVEAVRI